MKDIMVTENDKCPWCKWRFEQGEHCAECCRNYGDNFEEDKKEEFTIEEAIKALEEESCFECSWGCESPVKCDCPKCSLKNAVNVAIEVLKKQKL